MICLHVLLPSRGCQFRIRLEKSPPPRGDLQPLTDLQFYGRGFFHLARLLATFLSFPICAPHGVLNRFMALKLAFADLHPLGIFFGVGKPFLTVIPDLFSYAAYFLLPGSSAPRRPSFPAPSAGGKLCCPLRSGITGFSPALRPSRSDICVACLRLSRSEDHSRSSSCSPSSLAVPEHASLCGAGMTFPTVWAVIPPLPPIEVLQDPWARPSAGPIQQHKHRSYLA